MSPISPPPKPAGSMPHFGNMPPPPPVAAPLAPGAVGGVVTTGNDGATALLGARRVLFYSLVQGCFYLMLFHGRSLYRAQRHEVQSQSNRRATAFAAHAQHAGANGSHMGSTNAQLTVEQKAQVPIPFTTTLLDATSPNANPLLYPTNTSTATTTDRLADRPPLLLLPLPRSVPPSRPHQHLRRSIG